MTTASASRQPEMPNRQRVATEPESDLPFRLGTSGWSYPNWRRVFYPRWMKQVYDFSAFVAGASGVRREFRHCLHHRLSQLAVLQWEKRSKWYCRRLCSCSGAQ